MKKMRVLLVMLAIVGLMTAATRAATVSPEVGAYTTWLDSDDLDDGYGAGVKCGVTWRDAVPSQPNLLLGLEVQVGWLTFDGEDNDYGTDVDVFPVELTLVAKYEVAALNGALPYVGCGVGGYFFDIDDDNVLDVDDDVGFQVVAGWDQPVTDHLSVFAEVRYLWLKPDIESRTAESDIEVGGFGASAGVRVNW